MSEKIEDYPCCGGKGELIVESIVPFSVHVECTECWLRTPRHSTMFKDLESEAVSDAIKAWNRRASK